jgi:hypothetical protein
MCRPQASLPKGESDGRSFYSRPSALLHSLSTKRLFTNKLRNSSTGQSRIDKELQQQRYLMFAPSGRDCLGQKTNS